MPCYREYYTWLLVSASDKGDKVTCKAEIIAITVDKGRLSQDGMEGRGRQAEEFSEEDKKEKETVKGG
jgi:hypothetical protein